MKRGKTITLLSLATALTLATKVAAASTAVGNGGDVIERYLEATRFILREADAKIQAGEDTADLCTCRDTAAADGVCLALRALTPDQQTFCRAVIQATAAQVASLTGGPTPVPLTVSSDPLFATDAAGDQVEVAAETAPGPNGPVVFAYDRIRTMSPMGLLTLMTHAFTGKADYPAAGQYLNDHDPVGPFDQADGGRLLLDSVGAAIAWYAYEHQLVGREFAIVDSYTCEVKEATTGIDFSSLGSSLRIFQDVTNEDAYETGVGNGAGDLRCAMKETTGSQLTFRVTIHEESGCTAAGNASRYTLLELWRLTEATPPVAQPTAQRLASRRVAGWNPLCPASTPTDTTVDGGAPTMSLDYQGAARHYAFEVRYQGSTGRAGPSLSDAAD